MTDGQASVKLEFDFPRQMSKGKSRVSKKRVLDNEGTSKAPSKKRKVQQSLTTEIDDMYVSDVELGPVERVEDDEDGIEGENFDWSFSMRQDPPIRRKSKIQESDDEVIVLSE